MTKQFTYLLRVRYAECDAQQVVFNAKYVEYIDVAAFEYFRALFGDYNKLLERGLDMQVVNVNVSWKAPATYDDVIAMKMRLKKVGNSSIAFAIDYTNYHTKQFLATGEITYVMVSLKAHNKVAVPDDIRAQLEAGVTGMVNHAGVEA